MGLKFLVWGNFLKCSCPRMISWYWFVLSFLPFFLEKDPPLSTPLLPFILLSSSISPFHVWMFLFIFRHLSFPAFSGTLYIEVIGLPTTVQMSSPHKCGQGVNCGAFNAGLAAFPFNILGYFWVRGSTTSARTSRTFWGVFLIGRVPGFIPTWIFWGGIVLGCFFNLLSKSRWYPPPFTSAITDWTG